MTAAMADLVRAEGDWRQLGLCAQVDQELFYPEKGGSTKEAKRVCMACEVRARSACGTRWTTASAGVSGVACRNGSGAGCCPRPAQPGPSPAAVAS